MVLISPTDVFAAGIGLDVAGGYLVARGLLVSPQEILRRTLNDEHYFIPDATASVIADRVDAEIGLFALLSGFMIQGGGYALVAAGVKGAGEVNDSAWAALVAVGTAVLAGAAMLGVWRALRWRLARRLILQVARDPVQLDGNYFLVETGSGKISYQRLSQLATRFGKPPIDGETPDMYALRVFDVSDLDDTPDFLSTAFHPARLG